MKPATVETGALIQEQISFINEGEKLKLPSNGVLLERMK